MDERRKPNAPAGQRVDEDVKHTEVRQLEDFRPDYGAHPGGRFPIPSSDQDQGQPVEPSQANRPRRRGRRRGGEAAG